MLIQVNLFHKITVLLEFNILLVKFVCLIRTFSVSVCDKTKIIIKIDKKTFIKISTYKTPCTKKKRYIIYTI